MTLMETAQLLGNFGEFFGAIAVVVTLFYLAVQVRHSKEATQANTNSVDESRRLAMAQIYQSRAEASFAAFMSAAEVGGTAPIFVKYEETGFEGLSAVEKQRFRERALAQALWFDNLFYQYEQGYLEPDFYEAAIRPVLVANAKRWTDAGISPGRPSFKQEVERLL